MCEGLPSDSRSKVRMQQFVGGPVSELGWMIERDGMRWVILNGFDC